MTLVSATIPNLVNGVSQQPYALRLPSQAEEQINGYSSIVEGLRKRQPTRHVAKLQASPLSAAFSHTINRDTSERYEVIITNGDLKVYALDGTPRTVNFPNGNSYLVAADPQSNFRAVSIIDYTFIVNRSVTALNDTSTKTAVRPNEALIWFRAGNYSTTYKVVINGVTLTYTTSDASAASHEGDIKTDNLAAQFQAQIAAAPGLSAITVQNIGSSLYLTSASDFSVAVADGVGDTSIKLVKGAVQRFTDLPAKARDGIVVRVAGSAETGQDDYYVRFTADVNNPYGGVWVETAKPNELSSLDASTMPYVLVRESDGSFTFKQSAWDARLVGDLSGTNPWPSFVNRKINDVFFYRNRLGFLAGENVILSRSGKFFSFFRESAIQLLDTDQIDVAASSEKECLLHHATPFHDALLLFSDQMQFQLTAQDLLTPKTASITPTTAFESDLMVRPVGAGQNVYFAVSRGDYTGIREYYLDGVTKTNDAADVASHCPHYIPGNLVKLAASTNEDVLVALSANRRSSIYVYRFYWQKAEKLQSSWSRWDFGDDATVLNVDFILSNLWVLISRPDGVFLEVVNLAPGTIDSPGPYLVHLDRRVSETACAVACDSTSNTTAVTLPYPAASAQLVVWSGDATYALGTKPTVLSASGPVLTVRGRVTKFFVGVPYTFRYTFSKFIMREGATASATLQPVSEGRLQLRHGTVTYSNSGYFRVEITPEARDMLTYTYTGRTLGRAANPLGAANIDSGVFRFPISTNNMTVKIDLVNDTPSPCAFLSAGWEGLFTLRSRRV